jgi:hypothetical protein
MEIVYMYCTSKYQVQKVSQEMIQKIQILQL